MTFAVMIENVEAVANLDAILAVPGLDSVVIGPMDLSSSLDLLGQVDHPAVVEAMEGIIAKAHAAGLSVGAGVGDAKHAALMIQRGVQWIQMGGDSQYLRGYYEQMTGEVRARLAGQRGTSPPAPPLQREGSGLFPPSLAGKGARGLGQKRQEILKEEGTAWTSQPN